MRRQLVFAFVFVAVAAALPGFTREPVTLDALKQQFVADAKTPEGQAYVKQFFTNPWMLAFDAAQDACRAAAVRSAPHDSFVIALRIGDNGYPTDALVSPEDDGMKCVADRLMADGFIRPPHDGFAIYMAFQKTEPGTEHQLQQQATETTTGR